MPTDRRVLSYDDAFARAYDDIFSDDSVNVAPVDFLSACFDGASTLLELGVGTGRIAVPLSERGFRVIGVDDSEAMLQRLHDKYRGRSSIETIRSDMADLAGGISADGVYSVLGSLSCLLDADARRRVFASARAAVPAGARFVLEIYNPAVVRAMHDGRGQPVVVDQILPGRGSLSSRYLLDDDRRLWSAEHRWTTAEGPTSFGEIVALVDPVEMAAEAAPWWRPVALLRDWSGAPMDEAQGALVVLVLEAADAEVPS